MIQNKPTNPGYILILTLMLIGLMVAMVTQIFLRGQTYLTYSRAIKDRETAHLLALSGVQIALQQLFIEKKGEAPGLKTGLGKQANKGAQDGAGSEQGDDKEQKATKNPLQLSLAQTFPVMNQWQTYAMTAAIDGVDGQILIYISSEDGKLNINEFYDFDEKKFKETPKTKGAVRQALTDALNSIVSAGGEGAADELVNNLEQWLKKQGAPINDVTQLLQVEGFSNLVSTMYQRPDAEKRASGQLALTDLFTTWSPYSLDMWLLSRSWTTVLGFGGAARQDMASRKEKIKEWSKNASPSLQWPQAWDKSFKAVYDVGWDKVPKGIQPLLATQYRPRTFSVIAYGLVGRASQKLFAIVERQGTALVGEPYAIKKIYMI